MTGQCPASLTTNGSNTAPAEMRAEPGVLAPPRVTVIGACGWPAGIASGSIKGWARHRRRAAVGDKWMVGGVVVEVSVDMIEAVLKEYEAENPGRTLANMTSAEFSARMMKKVLAGAKTIGEPGNA